MTVPEFILPQEGSENRPGFFDMVLPPQAILLVVLLIVTAPIALLTGESLLMPFIEWVRSLFVSTENSGFFVLPPYFFIKLILFIVLCFMGGVQLILRINTIYYGTWALALERPYPLHPPYQPEAQLSAIALLNWSVYRLFHMLGPPLFMLAFTFGVGFLELYLLNIFSLIPVFGLPLQLIFGTFLMLMLGAFTGLACIRSVWVLLITLFGDVIAVTEPDLPVKTIMNRCRRIAFTTPRVLILYPCYALFCLALLGACILLLLTHDIEDVIHLKANFLQLLGIELLIFGVYLLLNYWNLSAYHIALLTYYNRLPVSFKERFAPVTG